MELNNITLKSKFKILISLSCFVLIITLFGVRLMGKANDFAYFERLHILSVAGIVKRITE